MLTEAGLPSGELKFKNAFLWCTRKRGKENGRPSARNGKNWKKKERFEF